MKLLSPSISAAFTLFSVQGCAGLAKPDKPSVSFLNPSVPVQINGNSQYSDMLMGVIHSKILQTVEPVGASLEIFKGQLYIMSQLSFVNEFGDFPDFERQNKILQEQGVDTTQTKALNERMIRNAFSGQKFKINNIFDIINAEQTFSTNYAYQSFDRAKLAGDKIEYRPGYFTEELVCGRKKRSCHNIPVLSDGEDLFGSLVEHTLDHASIDHNTREIITIVLGIGSSFEMIDQFANNLIALSDAQEKEAATRTLSMGVVSGYPAIYRFNKAPTPKIFCQVTPAVSEPDEQNGCFLMRPF